jgi:hypothetical protein
MGSKGFLAGRVIDGGGAAGPADAFRSSRPLLALVIPGSRCQALASGDGRVDGDETPQVRRVLYRDGDLDSLPVPLGVQPGIFGGPPWLRYPLCSRCPPDANTVRVSTATQCVRKDVAVRYYLPTTVRPDMWASPIASRRGSGRLATRIVTPDPHAGSRGTSEAPAESESQAGTAGSGQQAPTPSPRHATRGSGLASSQVRERIERARAAQQKAAAELAVLVDQAVGLGISWSRDRHPAGRDQTGCPPAIPAPPS